MVSIFLFAALSFSSPDSELSLNGWLARPPSDTAKTVQSAEGEVLQVVGSGSDCIRMLSPANLVEPGRAYILRFASKCTTTEGLLPCGLGGINRDFAPTLGQANYSFVLRVSDQPVHRQASLGQYCVPGTVMFSHASVHRVVPVHAKFGKIELGDGESLSKGEYVDSHDYAWRGSTIHRTLDSFNCEFNSNRWVIQDSSEVVYRYAIGSSVKSAKLDLNVNYYVSGKVAVSVSADGRTYTKLADYSKLGAGSVDLPESLIGNGRFWVRLGADSPGTSLQVNQYRLTAKTSYSGRQLTGKTELIEEPVASKQVGVQWSCGQKPASATITNLSNSPLSLTVERLQDGQSQSTQTVHLKQNGTTLSSMENTNIQGTHTQELRVLSGANLLYQAKTENHVSPIEDDHFGYSILSDAKGLDLWWCESNWKVGRDRAVPKGSTRPLELSACRGEYEAVQLVLRSGAKDAKLNKIAIGNLKNSSGTIPASAFTVKEVAYVPVSTPTDSWGSLGDYPDPLPPFQEKLVLQANRNQPIWISLKVPDGQPAGVYAGNVEIETTRGKASVPISVTVYDFDMPKVPNLKSALGINDNLLGDYAKTKDRTKLKLLFDKWMQNFAEHRISPYSFYPYAPIKVSFFGPETRRRVEIDWSEFDVAAKAYLDRYKLSSFRLNIQGLGGGTFYDREIGTLDGKKAGTPEYEALLASYLGQIEAHLKKNGWLDKAYVYWFDEPDAKDYPFVVEVNKRIKKYAPGLRRLLTEQPEKELIGNVEIWTGILDMWSKQTIDERNKAGDEVWWYICCGPKAPYVGEFIDHPGTEPRMWIWQTWQYGVHGVLIWTTNWWTSSTAFPSSLQNPWTDAMSYVDGYGTPKGTKLHWGNGDGRFLYPPRRDPNTATTEDISAPIDSMRWEALRDGMEDYEYFFLLNKLVHEKADKAGEALLAEALGLLKVPEAISLDLTHFTADPRLMLEHRNKVARMIERLAKL